jgi:hypothetical protein
MKLCRRSHIARLLLAALIATAPACGPRRLPFSDHEVAVLEATEAVIELFRQNPGAVWPGYDLSRQPFMIYIPEKWALLLNAPEGKPVEGFSALPAGWPDLGTPALYHEGQFRDLVGQLAFALPVGDLEVAAVGIPEGLIPGEAVPNPGLMDFIIHENFHEFQDKNFGEIPWAREERYPILDAGNTALATIEMALLKDALEPVYARDRAKIEEIVRLFNAVRKERWEKGPPFVRSYEQGQEIREGTAQYVQMKCVDLSKGLDYRSSVSSRNVRDVLKGLSPLAIRVKDFETRMKGNTIEPDDMIRNRIYPLGAALGFLADALGVAWKEPAQKAGPDFAFHKILSTALPPDEGSAPALVEEAKRRYGYEEILRATNESMARYKEGFRQALEAFESQPGIRIEIGFSYRSLSRSRVGAGRKWVIDDGAVTLGQTFRVFALKNDDLSVETRENGVLENDDWSGKKKRAAFFAPEITSLVIDGAAGNLEPLSSREFKTLELKGPNFAVSVKAPGALAVSGRTVKVSLSRLPG